jgi:hypothetical protein
MVYRCYLVNRLTWVQIGEFLSLVPGSPPTVSRRVGPIPGLCWLTKLAIAASEVLIKQSPWSLHTVYMGTPNLLRSVNSMSYL